MEEENPRIKRMKIEEEIPRSKRMKIEETVLNILKDADIETATEKSVRDTASQQLGVDLSDLASKTFIRQVLESFLLSNAASTTTPDNVGNDKVSVPEETKLAQVGEQQQDNGRIICKLSKKRNVAILYLPNGKPLVSIRDYYEKDGKQFPSCRGINITGRQWGCFRRNICLIERGIVMMQSRIMRSLAVEDVALQGSKAAVVQNQMETDIQDPINYVGTQSDTMEKRKHEMLGSSSSAHQVAVEGFQPQADTSPSRQGWHLPNNQLSSSTRSLVPIMTTRFNGKNYHSWRHQMGFFLKQLNVAYVLTDSCPSTIPGDVATTSIEENTQAEVAAKWVNDEYICRHNILNSLSDNLFEQYSKKKSYNAKELWEELKSDYSEEFGTVRSEVNKYIQFEMVDGISVVEQVQELNDIANSITKSGIGIDENLHVSVIISKLPPSWKEYRAKLMYYEVLSVDGLLNLLHLEEESRNPRKKENPFRMTTQVMENDKR